MQKITISDFSGGIQEAISPDDFTSRQWAELVGVVPRDETTFTTQWPAQRLGNITDVNAVFPLESSSGTFLVAIKTNGTLWWSKVVASSADYVAANAMVWAQLTTAANKGFQRDVSLNWQAAPPTPTTVTQPDISVTSINDYKFITGLPFEVYKYIRQPFNTRSWDFSQDYIPDNNTADPAAAAFGNKATAPGVLIGCRRKFRNTGSSVRFGIFNGTTEVATHTHQMLVAYVDPLTNTVKVATFPNVRRWPTFQTNVVWAQTTDNQGVTAGAETAKYPIIPKFITKENVQTVQGTLDDFVIRYPFTATDMLKYPNPLTSFHPFTYLNADSALLPGSGTIPRANVGTMWNNQLILGDIEWRSDKAVDASATGKVTIPANGAYLGYGALFDNNTEPHRGKLYYSQQDIDIFDPRSVISVASSDARVAAMFMLDNRLICVTTAGGPNDGVIALSGNLGQLISYSESSSSNPFAIRRNLVRGGVGVADYPESHDGHTTQACMWSETGTVVFVDASGGIFYTNGEVCDRLDRVGPRQPAGSTYYDHVAAAGRHLFVWRNQRLLVLTVLSSNGDAASGCWTELIAPTPFGPINSADDIKSMVGVSNQMFMVVQGAVYRYTMDGPITEYGSIDSARVTARISTATVGNNTGHEKTNWFRTGFSFAVPPLSSTATVVSISTKAEGALSAAGPTYAVSTNEAFAPGHHDMVVPSGIGRQEVASATVTFQGPLILGGVTFWGNGGVMSRDRT
jgi:hypothetical protein